jgi:hypothetical protein
VFNYKSKNILSVALGTSHYYPRLLKSLYMRHFRVNSSKTIPFKRDHQPVRCCPSIIDHRSLNSGTPRFHLDYGHRIKSSACHVRLQQCEAEVSVRARKFAVYQEMSQTIAYTCNALRVSNSNLESETTGLLSPTNSAVFLNLLRIPPKGTSRCTSFNECKLTPWESLRPLFSGKGRFWKFYGMLGYQ